MSASKHTPFFRVDDDSKKRALIFAESGCVAEINTFNLDTWEEVDAIADFIVLAVNSHDALLEALELSLLFHGGGLWTDEKRAKWLEITGADEATTKVMCDHIRAALQAARGQEVVK